MADETPIAAATPAPVPTAGSLLRRAREAQGLHIAVLAASLKVPQRKLEALERDRLDELPDATFARALAQTMCRALKIDPAPVLELLPRAGAGAAALDQVSAGLNTPFRDKPSAVEPAVGLVLRHPATVIVGLLLVAALALWFWPRTPAVPAPPPVTETLPTPPPAAEPASAAEAEPAASAASVAAMPLVETVHAAPDAAASTPPDPTDVATLLRVRASAESWVQVVDGSGQALLARTLQAGERVGLDGTPPLRLVIGNAAATDLQFRGRTVDLQPATRDNIARLELR
jgi:cytoskeleton protein RodZ